MATSSWAKSVLLSLMYTIFTMHFSACGTRKFTISYVTFSCEKITYDKVILLSSIVFLLIPFRLTLTSYILIYLTVLHMTSPEGENKALAICFSHLGVVSLYFGPAMIRYMTSWFFSPHRDRPASLCL